MKYMPPIESMNPIARVVLDDKHEAQLFDNIKSAGSVHYKFLLIVFDDDTKRPVYIVASEVNEEAELFGNGSHYLGVFDESAHITLDASDGWGDQDIFFAEAIRRAAGVFGIPLDKLR